MDDATSTEQMTPQDAACRILARAPAQYTYWEKRVWREGVIAGTRIATRPLERELAINLARQSALAHRSQHDYLPQSPEAAVTWQPHSWVLLAIQAAAIGTPATHGDRAALAYLMQRFDAETWQCPQCGHAEDTATMDSAEFLRNYLAENPVFSAPAHAPQEAVYQLRSTDDDRAWVDCTEAEFNWWQGRSRESRKLCAVVPQPTTPADSLSPLARIAAAFGITGTWDQIADAVIARGTLVVPGSDVEQLRRNLCVIGVVGQIDGHDVIRRTSMLDIVDRARQADASPKGALNEQFGSSERFPVSLFVRDCCEADKADPDHPDTICISVGELTQIARRHAAAASPKGGSEAPTYTTGHCENHKKPGGCPLHNLQCGYPQCDRRQAGDAEVQP